MNFFGFIFFFFSRFLSFHIFSLTIMASSFSSPWPDPNSPVLSKIDFGVPLVELFKWLDVRDTLLGQNYKKQDVKKALALARYCKHPDAEWLSSIFEGKKVAKKEEARQVFLSCKNDARALCFAWCQSEDREHDLTLLRRAAEMGNAFACSSLCEEVWEESEGEAFRLAHFAAAQHERDGFFWLAGCFEEGVGCEKDETSAKANFLMAAELGSVDSADDYGRLLGEASPTCWLWWSRIALHGWPYSLLNSFSVPVELFFSGSGNAKIVFLIGRALKGNIVAEKKAIFGPSYKFDSLIGPANRAVSFYDSQIESARLAVDTWTLVSVRLCLIKDMRIYVARMIWEARFEANYKDGRK